ncbi:MAG: SDR family NAD(P)-dependent oxidoreductase, partial [Spirochaetaceae bacterium]|nr:SDR family NAD(P)-dependent oxidoreductase [Spirochaetaceae bacterium]
MGIIEKLRLDGKKAFVTGGARGIGYNIAIALAEAGADVAIVDVDGGTAEKTAGAIARATGKKTIALTADVTKKSDVDAMIGTILAEFGRIDAAFCNAGICMNIPAEDMTLEDWNRVITINLTGVFLTAQAAGKVMIRQGGGSIINTASMSAHIVNVPQPQCSYNASKAGVIQL